MLKVKSQGDLHTPGQARNNTPGTGTSSFSITDSKKYYTKRQWQIYKVFDNKFPILFLMI